MCRITRRFYRDSRPVKPRRQAPVSHQRIQTVDHKHTDFSKEVHQRVFLLFKGRFITALRRVNGWQGKQP